MNDKSETLQIELGALAPRLSKQIPWIPDNKIKLLERFAASITLLSLHQLLTPGEARMARKRLVKEIQEEANDYRKSSL